MNVHGYMGISDEAPEAPDDGTIWRLRHLGALIALMKANGEPNLRWITRVRLVLPHQHRLHPELGTRRL